MLRLSRGLSRLCGGTAGAAVRNNVPSRLPERLFAAMGPSPAVAVSRTPTRTRAVAGLVPRTTSGLQVDRPGGSVRCGKGRIPGGGGDWLFARRGMQTRPWSVIVGSLAETQEIGATVGKLMTPGLPLCLHGCVSLCENCSQQLHVS